MARKYFNIESGTTDGSYNTTATTVTFAAGGEPGFALDADQHVVLAWGRFSDTATVELIHLVGPYTAGSSTATVRRGQEGVPEKSHTDGEEWRLVTTAKDLKKDLAYKPHSGNLLLPSRGYQVYDGRLGVSAYGTEGTTYELLPKGQWGNFRYIDRVTDADGDVGLAIKADAAASEPTKTKIDIDFSAEQDSTLTYTRRVLSSSCTFKVYLDGVEQASETVTNTTDAADVDRTLDLPEGTQTITFELEAATGGTKTVNVTDVRVTPDEDPTVGALYTDALRNLWEYEGNGSYRSVTGGQTEGRSLFSLNSGLDAVYGDNADISETVLIGDLARVEGATNSYGVAIGYKTVITDDSLHDFVNGWASESVVIGYEARAGGSSLAIGADAYVTRSQAMAVGSWAEAHGSDDTVVGMGAKTWLAVQNDGLTTGAFSGSTVNAGAGSLSPGYYTYYVVPYNARGEASSDDIMVEVDNPDSSVALTWNATTGATGYRIYGRYLYSDPTDETGLLVDLGSGTTTWTDDGTIQPSPQTTVWGKGPEWDWSATPKWAERTAVGSWSDIKNCIGGTAVGAHSQIGDGADDSTAIGHTATVTHARSTAIGADAASTKANQVVLGTNQEVTTVPGGLELSVRTVTSAITIDATQKETVVLADASAGGFTVTLPTAASGRVVVVKKIDSSANAVTVSTPSAATPATIDGSNTQTLAAQYNIMRLVSDGANWFLI